MIKKYALLLATVSMIVFAFAGCRNTAAGSMVSSAVAKGDRVVSGVVSDVISGVQGTTSSFLVSSAVSGV